MPPRKKPAGPTPVDAIVHADKRTNLPTADAHDFVSEQVEQPTTLRYPRDPSLDPQLVWKGKDAQDGDDLVVEAPPIYIQEKIDPRVLVENLRRTSVKAEDEPELTLFETFDGLDEMELVDFYEHQANWSNRMILGDSLQVMASLAEREALRGKVQMVYIDPPYGIRFGSNWQVSARKRDVKDGKLEDATREVEQIKAFRDTWELGIHSYLSYLRDRLVAARDLLTDSGSCFVQIGDENVHLVRSLMDEVFGSENFISTITFTKTTGMSSRLIANTADYILWFGRDSAQTKFRPLYQAAVAGGAGATEYKRAELPDGSIIRLTADQLSGRDPIPPDARPLTTGDITSDGGSAPDVLLPDGRVLKGKANVHWKTRPEGLIKLFFAGRLMPTGRFRIYKRFLDDFPAVQINNVWSDTRGESDKSYVVQTSATVVERCLLMSTDPGDLVVDPTCGSGSTAAVAEQWGRRWITIDTSRVALALARQRLMGARFPYYLLADTEEGRAKESEVSRSTLPPAETHGDIRHGFVYERVQHVRGCPVRC